MLISGAGGFIGIHCVKAALDASWSVVAGVRNIDDAVRTLPLRSLNADAIANGQLSIVETKLDDIEQWNRLALSLPFDEIQQGIVGSASN